MSYRCPLCLKLLNEKHQLTRHCTKHPDQDETFQCYPHLIPYKIFCQVSDCTSVNEIENGAFLCHLDCDEPNPFWDGNKVDVPGNAGESLAAFQLDFEQGSFISVQVQHWLIGILRDLPQRKEMWFPLMLLRGTGERNGNCHVGRFVELAGATAAGKTVLAIQAMNKHAYVGGVFHLNSFIFSRVGGRQEGAFVNFIQTLHLNSLLRRASKELFLPRSTPPGPRNLRVAFFKPVETGSAGLPDSDRNLKGYSKRLLRMVMRGSVRFMKDNVNAGFREIFGSQGFRPYWHSLAFYDKSGEAFENEDVMRDPLDKVAVVIDAKEIFGLTTEGEAASEKSIQVAVQRLSQAVERKQLCYLVITQLDRVRHLMGENDWKTVGRLADNLREVGRDRSWLARQWQVLFPAESTIERRLLEEWLSKHNTENHSQLKASLRGVEAIFFVWTENLPELRTPSHQSTLPLTHGLARFVCRCLDVEWEQIANPKN